MAKTIIAFLALLMVLKVQSIYICVEEFEILPYSALSDSDEVYFVCEDGSSAIVNLDELDSTEDGTSASACVEVEVEAGISCQFLSEEGQYDSYASSFTINSGTFDEDATVLETDDESYSVILRACENPECTEVDTVMETDDEREDNTGVSAEGSQVTFGVPPAESEGTFGVPPGESFGVPAEGSQGTFGVPPAESEGTFGVPPAESEGTFGVPPAESEGTFGVPPEGSIGVPPAASEDNTGVPPAELEGTFGVPPGESFGVPPAEFEESFGVPPEDFILAELDIEGDLN